MDSRSSTASRILVCLVALLVCGAGTVGIVAAATGGSASLETDDGSLTETVDETDDSLENTTNGTTDDLENATNETAGEIENTTNETTGSVDEPITETSNETTDETENETTDDLEETSNETADDLENTINDTTDEVDKTEAQTGDDLDTETDDATDGIRSATDETTDELDETVDETTTGIDEGVDETTDTLENGTETVTNTTDEAADAINTVANETTDGVDEITTETTETVDRTIDDSSSGIDGDGERSGSIGSEPVDLEVSTSVSADSADSSESADDDDADAASGADTGGGNGGVSTIPDGTSSTTDAVLVGLLGTITAAGAAAGSASATGGAAGASASAGAGAGAGAAAGSAGAGAGAAGAAGGAAAGGATGFAANWFGQSSALRYLRRAGSLVPWKLLPIFRYSRYDDSDPLENDRRRTIYETIADDPGCYLSEVSERSGVALSTVRHHVRILEEEGLVAATKVNGKRRYVLEDDGVAADDGDAIVDVDLHAALAEPAKREVLETLAKLGPAPNGRLADELERDPSTVSHHLSGLEDDGLVVREKDGRSVVNELVPAVETTLRSEDATLEDVSAETSVSAPADD